MGTRVKISEIIQEMNVQPDEGSLYLNKKTGEVVMVTEEVLRAAEEEDSLEEYPPWQQKAIKVAHDILDNSENYVELPSKYEINEYRIMEDFCNSIEDPRISEVLSDAIKGRGAFKRFKDSIVRLGIADRWYKYSEEAFRKIAIEWCEDNNIDYIDG